MLDIEIETIWRFRKEGTPQTVVLMLGVLDEIGKTGKITSAAKDVGLSYRHVWNLIEQWSDFFGTPLVETRRGKGSKLTAFGEKLVWAGQRRSLPPRSSPSCIKDHPSFAFMPATASRFRNCGSCSIANPASASTCDMSAISIRWSHWHRAPAIFPACICRAADYARRASRRARNGWIRVRTG